VRSNANLRGGFSLAEGMVALVVIALFTAAALYWTDDSASDVDDLNAQSSLASAYEGQLSSLLAGDGLAGPDELAELEPGLDYRTGPSNDDAEVSVQLDDAGGIAHLAVRSNTGACWMLRITEVATADAPQRLWAVREPSDSLVSCSAAQAQVAINLDIHDGQGLERDQPWVLGGSA